MSERKLAANRANARRSTGPVTAEGKARSAMNAVKHGLSAQTPLLPGESPVELLTMRAEYENYYADASPVEKGLLARIIAVNWKLRRCARAEEQMMADEHAERLRPWGTRRGFNATRSPEERDFLNGGDPMPYPRDGATFQADACKSEEKVHPMERLCQWENRLTGQMVSLARQLTAQQKLRGPSEPPVRGQVTWQELAAEEHPAPPPVMTPMEKATLDAFPAAIDESNALVLAALEKQKADKKAAAEAAAAAAEAQNQPTGWDQIGPRQITPEMQAAMDAAYITEEEMFPPNAKYMVDDDEPPMQNGATG